MSLGGPFDPAVAVHALLQVLVLKGTINRQEADKILSFAEIPRPVNDPGLDADILVSPNVSPE